MEILNPGPVAFDNEPLSDVTSCLPHGDAQYGCQVALMSDAECRHSIAHIAREVYNHEQQTTIWHKKNCGDRAGKNLVYSYLCKVHGKSDHKQQALHDVQTTTSPSPCHFMGSAVKPCQLPDLDSQHVVHLAYFECLCYVTLSKIQELHDELRVRLDHGLISPGSTIIPKGSSDGLDRRHVTVEQFLEQLHHFWNHLTRPELIATLDTAVRLRKLGHCSVVLGDGSDVIMDCRDIRASLLIQDVENARNHDRFVHAPGLIDIFGNKLSGFMVCLLVGDLHRDTLREKEAFEAHAMRVIELIQLQAQRLPQSEGEPNQTGNIKHAEGSPESTCHTAPPLPSARALGSHCSGNGLVSSHATVRHEATGDIPTSEVKVAVSLPAAQRGRRGQGRNPATLQILRAVAQAADKRRHGPREQYALNLYHEVPALSRKSLMAAAFDRLPSSPKAMASPHNSINSIRKAPRAPGTPLRSSYRATRSPKAPLSSSIKGTVAERIARYSSPVAAASPLMQATTNSKQATASPLKQAATSPVNQAVTNLEKQDTISPLKQTVTSPPPKQVATSPPMQAGGGYYRPPSLTKITQPAMPLPAIDGTWSMTKEKLYALLPDTPLYDTTPPRLMMNTPMERSTSTSFKLLGLKVDLKVHIQKV